MLQTTTESRTGGGVARRPAAGAEALAVSATSVASAIDIVDVPVPRRGRRSVLHFRLDDGRQSRGERRAQRRTQFVRRLDTDAAGAVGSCARGVIRAVAL